MMLMRQQIINELYASSGYVEPFSEDQLLLLQNAHAITASQWAGPAAAPQPLRDLLQRHAEQYAAFSEDVPEEEIGRRILLAKAYGRFRPHVDAIRGAEERPRILGKGSNATAYGVRTGDREYAVKILESVTGCNHELGPLLLAKGLERTAQIAAYSIQDKVLVTGLLPGTNLSSFNAASRPHYSDGDLLQLIDTICAMDRRGLTIDPKPSNFMYDPAAGFSILDYHAKGPHHALPKMIMMLKNTLSHDEAMQSMCLEDEAYMQAALGRKLCELEMAARLAGIMHEHRPALLPLNWDAAQGPLSFTYGAELRDSESILASVAEFRPAEDELAKARTWIAPLQGYGFLPARH